MRSLRVIPLSLVCLACADDPGEQPGPGTDTSSTTDTPTTETDASETDEAETQTEAPGETEAEAGTETETETGEPEGCVIRVKPDGDDALLGLSWLDAKATLGAALDAAEAMDRACAIWVAAGTYHPTADGDRTASFTLRDGVWVYGGFAGDELLLEQRDWIANVTTLSGDIGVPGDHSDNSHHVVVAADDSRLDGFVITGGHSEGASNRNGAGILALDVDFTLAHAIVTDNVGGDGLDGEIGSIGGQGGSGVGLFQIGGSLRIEDVVFSDNVAGNGGDGISIGGFGGEGAGAFVREVDSLHVLGSSFIANRSGDGGEGGSLGGTGGPGGGLEIIGQGAEVVIADCLFEGNATGQGGPGSSFDAEDGPFGGFHYADYVGGGSLLVANTEIVGNTAVYGGGAGLGSGMNAGGSLTLVNVVLRANTADQNAGALLVNTDGSASVTLANLTVTGNSAPQAGGVQWNGAAPNGANQGLLVNSIVWGNTADFFPDLWAPKGNMEVVGLLVDFSDVGGGCVEDPLSSLACGFTVDLDPVFEDPLTDLHLQPGSPLLDAGQASALPPDAADLDGDADLAEPTPVDLDGLARVVGPQVDLGAYELP